MRAAWGTPQSSRLLRMWTSKERLGAHPDIFRYLKSGY
jgi:hypothetical protein